MADEFAVAPVTSPGVASPGSDTGFGHSGFLYDCFPGNGQKKSLHAGRLGNVEGLVPSGAVRKLRICGPCVPVHKRCFR